MLKPKTSGNGVVVFISPLLDASGVPHGFSTRIGGISSGPYASLNLGNPGDAHDRDPYSNLIENYSRLFAACGMSDRILCRVHQVHGNAVITVDNDDQSPRSPASPLGPSSTPPQADALVTSHRKMALSIRTADCIPILIASRDGTQVAAVHAGWRGVIANVLGNAITSMQTNPTNLLLAIGPCIGVDAFEVGEEVASEFARTFVDRVIIRQLGKRPRVDLRAAVISQATSLGIPSSNIDYAELCTYRDQKFFFSHRRDNGLTGRLAAIIGTQ